MTSETAQNRRVERLLLTSREAAESLGICERTLFALTKAGDLRVVRIGRAVRYSVEDLRDWIKRASQKEMTNSQGTVE